MERKVVQRAGRGGTSRSRSGDLAASNFYCGDDAAAKQIVRQLVEDVGFDAIDAGPLASARLIEPLMMLWMASSRAVGSRDIAFRVLRR
ncbi:MAG: hypothetical protein IPQ07_37550 [Myxococcales bacterium]|nr:hypothetical protein [Myxococcales bacterium]